MPAYGAVENAFGSEADYSQLIEEANAA